MKNLENKSPLEQLARTPEELEESKKIIEEYNRMMSPLSTIYTIAGLTGGAIIGGAASGGLIYLFLEYLKN